MAEGGNVEATATVEPASQRSANERWPARYGVAWQNPSGDLHHMATLNVRAGQAYATLSAAVAASRDGDVIVARTITYVNNFATISKDITIG